MGWSISAYEISAKNPISISRYRLPKTGHLCVDFHLWMGLIWGGINGVCMWVYADLDSSYFAERSVIFPFLSLPIYLFLHHTVPATHHSGPMVWYQKFEYAVGHWLQKTAEHVFGSVLCSPGCFSLFRGSALMDDNVMKRYTTTSTRASEYVQYDQGWHRPTHANAPSILISSSLVP